MPQITLAATEIVEKATAAVRRRLLPMPGILARTPARKSSSRWCRVRASQLPFVCSRTRAGGDDEMVVGPIASRPDIVVSELEFFRADGRRRHVDLHCPGIVFGYGRIGSGAGRDRRKASGSDDVTASIRQQPERVGEDPTMGGPVRHRQRQGDGR